jgi:lipopolysaccharide heptosyltransferase I
MASFLIVRLSSLGDIIHTLPAFAALRRSYPEAEIRWAVGAQGKNILDLVPGIDQVVLVGRKIWLRNIRDIRRRDQVALDFQGLVKSALLAYSSGSRRVIGFSRENCKEPLAASFYKERLPRFSEEDIHVIAKNLRLLRLIGVEREEFEFPIVVPEELRRSVLAKLARLGYAEGRRLLLVNLGAAWETKRWFPGKWTEVLRGLKLDDAFPLILWGNPEEKGLAGAVSEKTGAAMAPFLTVKEVLALVREASLLVSGDTFALQVACAFSIPVVGLFGPTAPRRNGPFLGGDIAVTHRLDCAPCYKRTCPTLGCLKAITVEEVVAAVRQLWCQSD